MDFESLGSGAATGFLASILTLLGWNRRLSLLEKEKQDKGFCEVMHRMSDANFKALHDGQEKIFDRIDKINEFLRNQR